MGATIEIYRSEIKNNFELNGTLFSLSSYNLHIFLFFDGNDPNIKAIIKYWNR
jgi:hypothetical protein